MENASPEPSGLNAHKRYPGRVSAVELGFHATALVWLCTVAALWIVGWTMAHFSAPAGPADPEVAAAFVPWARAALLPEPGERRLYIVLTFLTPPFLLAAWAVARRARRGSGGSGAASAAVVFILGGCLAHLWLSPSVFAEALQPAASLLPAAGVGVLALWWMLTRCVRCRPVRQRLWRWTCLTAVLALAVAGGVAYHLFDYRNIALMSTVNLNTALYPIAQAVAGQRILVDFLPQYGCYAEMLKPWFAVIGLSTFKTAATLAGLQCISLASVVFVLWRLLRSGWLLLLGASMLLWLTGVWQQAVGHGFDPYLQYDPIRVVFPALSLLAAWAYLRRPTVRRAGAAGLLGGIGTWWNIDSGAVTLVALLGLILAKTLSDGLARRAGIGRWRGVRHLAAATGTAALGLVGFYLILCLDARHWVDLGGVLRYQGLFYISGFSMMPMPVGPHLWQPAVGIYVLGLAAALGVPVARRPLGSGNGMMLYLSLLGLGLFSYYQGRSHDLVLMLCVWPAGTLALLWCDRQLTAARYGLLPRGAAAAALPALAVVTLCALSLWQSSADIFRVNVRQWQAGRAQPAPTHIPAEVAYLKGELKPGEPCAILSPWQTAYFLAAPRRSAFTGQSLYECLLYRDVEHYLDQLRGRRAARLFTEHDAWPGTGAPVLGADYHRARYDGYRVVGRSPDGRMVQWAARDDEDMRAGPTGRLAREYGSLARLRDSPPAPLHALRLLSSAGLLLDEEGECATAPYDWGSVPFGDAWAIELAFTPAAGQTPFACLVSNHPGGGYDGLTIQQVGAAAPEDYVCLFGNGHGYTPSAPLRFEPGREYYLALCGEANRVTIYVDGAPRQEVALPGPVTASATPLTVGDWIAANRAFRGDVAEVKIHDRALTPETVARNAANLRAAPPPAQP